MLEVAFEGLQRSTRHKSGIAMRFPRISRLRWDKPPGEADRLETLEKMLETKRTCALRDDMAGYLTEPQKQPNNTAPIALAARRLAVLVPSSWCRSWSASFCRCSASTRSISSHSVERLFCISWNMGFDAGALVWRYFLLGAVLVIPIWLIMRLVNAPRGKR